MAKCPNCDAQLPWDAPSCGKCGAVFSEKTSAWHPIAEGAEESAMLADLYRGRQPAEPSPDEGAIRVARLLTRLAVAGWTVSLFLPGFVVQSRTQAETGIEILLLGLLFGWAVGGWAAYANLFFAFVVVRLLQRREAPMATGAMVLLAVTIVFFQGVIRDEGTAMILPVVSWGWGAVLWMVSLLVAAVASGLHSCLLSSRGAWILVAGLAASALGLGMLHLVQRNHANEQEREIYLSAGTAFTTAAFCGVPFVWPAQPVIESEEPVALDIESDPTDKKSGPPHLMLPHLSNAQDLRFHWHTFPEPAIPGRQVKLRFATPAARYVLQTRRTAQGATIRILDTKAAATLYEQPLVARKRSDVTEYCPYSTGSWAGLEKGYDTAILRAVGQTRPPTVFQGPSRSQIARQPCDIGDTDVNGVSGLREWDGRHVILEPPYVRSWVGFCSDDYIALVYVSRRNADPTDLSPAVDVFDRRTLRPLAAFDDDRPCRPLTRCDEAPRQILKGVRIEPRAVIVETEHGALRTHRVSR